MEEKNNKKLVLAIIGVLVLIAGIVGITYAYFMAQAESENITITSKSLTLKYGPENDSVLVADDIGPITEDKIEEEAVKKTFSIAKQKETDKDVYARIDIADIEISDNFKDYDLKWALYQGTTKLTTGSFVQTLDGSTTINMANNILINSTAPIEYTLYIWIQETEKDQSELMGGTLTAKIKIAGEDTKQNTLASVILGENNKNVLSSTPSFTETSTDLGLHVQQNDSGKSNYGFPTYYYKGDVTDNYVELGTYKSDISNNRYSYDTDFEEYSIESTKVASTNDPILWRIMRINEDGSIKLISELNNNVSYYNANASVLYINEDGSKSEIKDSLDTWYETHITENNIDNIIQYGNYCNDITGEQDYSYYYYGAFTRLSNKTPIFTCPNEAVMINEKVGTITADELMYGGVPYDKFMTSDLSYLNNGSASFYTMTPLFFSDVTSNPFIVSYQYIVSSDSEHMARITSIPSNYNDGIRPVITIKADTLITGGTGLADDPYTIKLN